MLSAIIQKNILVESTAYAITWSYMTIWSLVRHPWTVSENTLQSSSSTLTGSIQSRSSCHRANECIKDKHTISRIHQLMFSIYSELRAQFTQHLIIIARWVVCCYSSDYHTHDNSYYDGFYHLSVWRCINWQSYTWRETKDRPCGLSLMYINVWLHLTNEWFVSSRVHPLIHRIVQFLPSRI